jgi:malonate transporter
MSTIVATLLLPACVGYALGAARALKSPDGALEGLQRVAASVGFPALVVSSLATQPDAWPSHPLALFVVPAATTLALAALAATTGTRAGLHALVATFGNVAYLGFPVVAALCGPAALGRASLFASEHVIFSLVVGMPLIAGWAPSSRRPPLARALREGARVALRHPLFWSPAVGLGLRAAGGEAIGAAFTPLGQAASPLAALALGLWAQHDRPVRRLGEVPVDLVLTRLVALPAAHGLLAAAGARLGWIDRDDAVLLVLLAAMPVGMSAYAVAADCRQDEREAGRAVLASTVLAALSTPLWYVAIQAALGTP